MRLRRFTTLFAALLALSPFAVGAQGRHTPDAAAVRRLEAETSGGARLGIHSATGAVRSIRLQPGTSQRLMRGAAPSATQKQQRSMSFLREYSGLFGVKNPEGELQLSSTRTDRLGETHLTWRQHYRGIPVFAGELRTHFSAANELKAVGGTFIPGIDVNPRPAEPASSAVRVARDLVAVQRPDRADTLRTVDPSLVIFRAGLLQGVPGDAHLAWQVEVTNGLDVREFVFVDAHTGKLIDQITGIHDALDRRAFDGHTLANIPANYPHGAYWLEGHSFPTLSTEANNMLLASRDTYDFFFNAFGRDSFDGAGRTMDSIFDRGYSCPNASWNGVFISFCAGLTTDDVTGHEWGHAYTDYLHDLIYQWQSGALNESYSDIWGEIVDRINDRDRVPGDENPRTANACSMHTPPVPTVRVHSPAGIAGDLPAQAAAFGPGLSSTGITGEVVAAIDVVEGAGFTAFDGCSPFSNAPEVAGKIALVYRGGCNFTVKVKNAQNAGAVAAIVANNGPSGMAPMGGEDPTVVIPSVGITRDDGYALHAAQEAGPVAVTLLARAGTDDSVRWLIGEDGTNAQIGSALRDMHNPNCLGNPGKVSDVAYYECTTADAGGVHINSGIPNRAFVLLADGGSYNGLTVQGIGLTRAAHIYFRAAEVYQVQDSNFADHADALEASCADLIGQPLNALTSGPSGEVITAQHCAEVAKAIDAVELRMEPTFCNFQPLLRPGKPVMCGAGTDGTTTPLFADSFSTDPSGNWTATRIAAVGATPRDWTWDGDAFFAPDPHLGRCQPGDDETAVLSLDSPAITLPSTANYARVRFRHLVATEPGWDGGNLKVRVNGGAWQQLQPGDFSFNGYNVLLYSSAQGNTNPLAGTATWSGNDNGTVNGGSWGYTLANLARYAKPGDTIQLRWDFGTDCAAGRTGWYVDDVEVASCKPNVPTAFIDDVRIVEGDTTRNVNIPVRLSTYTLETVSVVYTVHDGTAITGNDYLPLTGGVVTFPPGATTANIVVSLKGDKVREADETFEIRLTGAAKASVAQGEQGVVTIVNDD